MGAVTVRHLDGDRFRIGIRDHELTVDQPVADGGSDTAPTPTELFVASLTACVGFYALRYLARHALPVTGLAVTADYATASQPARVGNITISIHLPDGVPDQRLAALLAVASHCTVHNSLTTPPTISIVLDESSRPKRVDVA
jgi:putative redox protein